jgi:carbonic anhydrase/acetyltransferase-like protein (isoleucine patch superfamily)
MHSRENQRSDPGDSVVKVLFQAERFSALAFPESLEGEAGERLTLGLSLASRQDRAILLARGAWATKPEHARLWIREDVLITPEALFAFVDTAKDSSKPVQWSLGGRAGNLVEELRFGDKRPLMLWLPEGGPPSEEHLTQTEAIRVDPKEQLVSVPVAKSQFGADAIELPISDRIVIPTSHWLQLLWANLLGIGPYLWRELVGKNPVSAVFNLSWAVLRAASLEPDRIGAKLGRKGKKCRIHPSAVVEGCWLGDGVKIGANAVVRGSILSDGVEVEDLSLVEFSILGQEARVQRQGMVKFSVLSDGSAAAGAMQLGVLDRRASLKRGGFLMDMNLSGEGARVLVNGTLCNAPLGLAGCCVGTDTTVGLGVQVASGRLLPPRTQIVADPATILRRIPPESSGLLTVRDGGLQKP